MAGGRVWCIFLVLWCCCRGFNCLSEGDDTSDAAPVPDCLLLTGDDDDLPTDYVPLPTTITLKPRDPDWQLDFILQGSEEESPKHCVSLQNLNRVVRLSIFDGQCEEENKIDSQFWTSSYVKTDDWNAIQVTYNETAVILKLNGSSPKPLGNKITLPKQQQLQVTNSESVDFALGCRVNCPAMQILQSNTTELTTIPTLEKRTENLFFWPDEDFQLTVTVQCKTKKGQQIEVAQTTLTSKQVGEMKQWHRITFDFNNANNVFKASVDNKVVQKISKGLQACTTFRGFSVAAAGDSYVSLNCDPNPSVVARNVTEVTIDRQKLTGGDIAALIIASIIVIGLNFGMIWFAAKLTAWQEKRK